MNSSIANDLYELLITRDFDPKPLDVKTGKSPLNDQGQVDVGQADMFSFDWTNQGRNYGTVVTLLKPGGELEVYYSDNLGRGMEPEDKKAWFDFLEQLKNFAVRRNKQGRGGFSLNDLPKLKYTMAGMAAIKEGLFEGYYGSKKISYSDQPKKTRLMIRHSRPLGESDARYRFIESLFVETDQGERFKLPFKSLLGGKVMARHIAEGGTPYDAFGQHITQLIDEVATLSKFVRAVKHRAPNDEAKTMAEIGIRHYGEIKQKVKKMLGRKGYHEELSRFRPDEFRDSEVAVEAIRDMFIEQNLDSRIEEALPLLAKLSNEKSHMKEADEFESWANRLAEGTWALPDTPEQIEKLKVFMSKPQPVGPDASNATSVLYDIIGDDELFDMLGDLADENPDADARIVVKNWIQDHQFDPQLQDMLRPISVETDADDQEQNLDIDLDDQEDEVKEATRIVKGPHGDLEVTDTPTGQTVKRVSGWEKMNPGSKWEEPDDLPWHGSDPRAPGNRKVYRDVSFDEDLDTDGVMMTRQSNMSSESRESDQQLYRLIELAKK